MALVVSARYQGLEREPGWTGIHITPFTPASSLELFEKELGRAPRDAREREALRTLAGELGHLPLALHLAASALREGDFTPDTFLEDLRRRRLDLAPGLRDDPRANLRKTFELSLSLLRRHLERDGLDADELMAGFFALGHAPVAGFGRALGATIAGLSRLSFSQLTAAARKLSLLMALPWEERNDDAWRVHPLLAERLREDSDGREVLSRMTEWFIERLQPTHAKEQAPQGQRWPEVHAEHEALAFWLMQVLERSPEDVVRVERAGSEYAIHAGQSHAWESFLTRALDTHEDANARSNLLWTLAHVAMRGGELEKALNVAAEKERIDRARGDDKEVAIARSCRADILEARGELKEALRILQEEMLPLFEKLDDMRSRAVTKGKIADILEARGELEEALRIRKEEALPVFEKLGDVRSSAVTKGKIADIQQARGELEEALRIRKEEQLPVYEKLGDVRSSAVTKGKIADIQQARGELEEALRIRKEEELPVYERLGAARDVVVCRTRIALVLLARGQEDDRRVAAKHLSDALDAARRMQLPEAKIILQIQQHHGLN
ncbi:hypothetical protein [Chondromyces crocatus]|uniref:hypothetical protein n=1 Tax=Chondromyces crocatus TaxID=52 RepID=UPI001FE17C7D|nr:hypothetical protein [Chondromyces crocatus]